jgi:2,5-dioxopentanoate dehydrogenase
MIDLHGKNLIAGKPSARSGGTFRALAPKSGDQVGPPFAEASAEEIDAAATHAEQAFETFSAQPGSSIATLLERIAEEIERLGDDLIQTATEETALPADRLTGERARTVNQLRMFAGVARDGSWRDPRIDRAMEDRKPLRRPDLRRTLIPLGPVAVWAASNFPLAFSVAGGDTASALAAGCPVIVKAHPGHPGTSELVAGAITRAIADLGLPPGIFSLLHGVEPATSLALVRHPKITAGAFTGSLRAGWALYNAAAVRGQPIPFFAEMGSVNPVFLLKGAVAERGDSIADGLSQSVNLGVGQFCTCPGVVVAQESPELEKLAARLRGKFTEAPGGVMLTQSIVRSYRQTIHRVESLSGVTTVKAAAEAEGRPVLFETSAATFLAREELRHEVFGPSTILVRCAGNPQLEAVARALEGTLTATLHGTPEDLDSSRALITILQRKAGRLVFNAYPTGVEVCAAMQHGGPYPATTDARFTSVGTAAIQRFARPICFQDCPQSLLPPELRD